MNINRFGSYGAVTVTAVAISLVLSACGAQPANSPGGESTAPVSAGTASSPAPVGTPSEAAAPSTAADSSAQPVAAAPAEPAPAVPAQPAAPAAPVQPALKTFTFPDGHISFSYPAAWSVRTQRGPGVEGPTSQPVEAVVSDGAGADVLRAGSGALGIGCTGGPAHRTVLDSAAVPGMVEADGTVPQFGFIVERISGQDHYAMAVLNPRDLQEGEVTSHCSLLFMGNGGATSQVIFFDEPVHPNLRSAFSSQQAAQEWMATQEYAQLKSLMLSLKYS